MISANIPPKIVCLGRFTIDDVTLPDGTSMPNCTGGNALYASLGARLWEPATEIVVAIGNDLPESTWEQITSAGYRMDGFRNRHVNTMHNQITYDQQGGRKWTHYFSEQISNILSPAPEDIPTQYLSAQIFLVQAMPIEAQERLIPWLREHTRGFIALDLKETMILGNEARLSDLISRVDIFMPSRDEAFLLTQSEDWPAVAAKFAKLGPRYVIIKRNKHGSMAYDAVSEIFVETPAYPVEVVDATGAGDAFCGGFLATFLNNASDLKACIRAGAVSSSFAISGYGSQRLASTTPEEARQRLRTWNEETNIL
jgi:sugar/nucleoside kinase (ribokinase family)